MRLVVGVGDGLQRPICGAICTLLEEGPGTTAIASGTGEWRERLDPEAFPARGEGEYEVYFREENEEQPRGSGRPRRATEHILSLPSEESGSQDARNGAVMLERTGSFPWSNEKAQGQEAENEQMIRMGDTLPIRKQEGKAIKMGRNAAVEVARGYVHSLEGETLLILFHRFPRSPWWEVHKWVVEVHHDRVTFPDNLPAPLLARAIDHIVGREAVKVRGGQGVPSAASTMGSGWTRREWGSTAPFAGGSLAPCRRGMCG